MRRLLLGAVLSLVAALASSATPTLTLTWAAPTMNVDLTPITAPLTYQLYAGASGKEVKLGNPVTSPPYVITPTPAPGVTTCFQVSAIANGIESSLSNEACGTIPFPTPNSPTTVIITIK